MVRIVIGLLALFCGSFIGSPTKADNYPNRTIRIIVGFAPGGPTDVVARLICEKLSQRLKQPIVVENVSGAGGEIATQQLVRQPPDGYTLMWAASAQVLFAPVMQTKPRVDPLVQLTPIAISSIYPYIVAVAPSLPVKSMSEFVAYAKKNPGKLSFGSAGAGTANHLAGEWLNQLAGLDMVHVAYRGDSASTTDLIAGNIQLGFVTPNQGLPMIQSGRLVPLAVTGKARHQDLPNVPTMEQAGFPRFVAEMFNGLVGPAGVPKEIVDMLNRDVNEITKDPDMIAKFKAIGYFPASQSPEEFKKLIQDETTHWREVIRDAHIPRL